MRALTLHRHWAAAVMHCGKRLENRKRPPPRNLAADEVIAIHAGMAGGTPTESEALRQKLEAGGLDVTAEMLTAPAGAMVAVCRVGGWVEKDAYDNWCRWRWDGANRAVRRFGDDARGAAQVRQVFRWWIGPYAWELLDVQVLAEPVPARGALGLWRLPEDAERAVRVQLVTT